MRVWAYFNIDRRNVASGFSWAKNLSRKVVSHADLWRRLDLIMSGFRCSVLLFVSCDYSVICLTHCVMRVLSRTG